MRTIKGILAVALVASTTACLDLDVINQNAPDIERALRDPADVETVIASAFNIWFNTYMQGDFARVYSHIADQNTTTLSQRGVYWAEEPRQPLNNDPNGEVVWVPRAPWDSFSECVANTNDGLKRIKAGLKIMTINPGETAVSDNTHRATMFAKLMQGLCLGSLAMALDQIAAAQEDTIVPQGYADQVEWERTHLKPYGQIKQMATASLEEAINLGTTGPAFTTPITWINQISYSNVQLTQLARTVLARVLVLTSRTPQERAAVDWQKVLSLTANGLTFDFGPTLQSGVLTSNNWVGVAIPGSTISSTEHRVDYKYLGGADQSGAYQAWFAATPDQRQPFFIVTPDRRVAGAAPTGCTGTACSPNGAYFRNRNSISNFTVSRGTQYQSYYGYYKRNNSAYGAYTGTSGPYYMVTEDENRLLRAEALLRTGNVQGAVDLINISRTRSVRIGTTVIANNLPAIPPTTSAATRVPTVANACVPRRERRVRRHHGCADLGDQNGALPVRPMRWWSDARGLGLLLPGTLLHMPIPGRYLVSLGLPVYTYGGVGGEGAAK
jgi:hypothetical protein